MLISKRFACCLVVLAGIGLIGAWGGPVHGGVPSVAERSEAQPVPSKPAALLPVENSPLRSHLYPPTAKKPRLSLSKFDELATLYAIQLTLDEVEDGARYVWRRHNGRLTGVFHPTRSFRGANGRTCRHLIIRLSTGRYSRKTEGIACRNALRRWVLEG